MKLSSFGQPQQGAGFNTSPSPTSFNSGMSPIANAYNPKPYGGGWTGMAGNLYDKKFGAGAFGKVSKPSNRGNAGPQLGFPGQRPSPLPTQIGGGQMPPIQRGIWNPWAERNGGDFWQGFPRQNPNIGNGTGSKSRTSTDWLKRHPEEQQFKLPDNWRDRIVF